MKGEKHRSTLFLKDNTWAVERKCFADIKSQFW